MSLSKHISIFFFLFITLFIALAHAARFDITNNCPYAVWAAAVPGGGRRLNPRESWPLDVNAGTKGARIWAELGAILMGLAVADVKLVTVVGFFNAKPMVHPQTHLLNMR
ncbi:protein P21-like [Fagus crenata]